MMYYLSLYCNFALQSSDDPWTTAAIFIPL